MKGKRRKRTAFVPTVVFGSAAVLGVLPVCVTGCGGTTTSGGDTDGGADAKADVGQLTVAAIGFDASMGQWNDSGPIQVPEAATPADDGSADAGSDSGLHIVPLAYMGFDVRYFKQGD